MQAAFGDSANQTLKWGKLAKQAFSLPLVKIAAVVAAVVAVVAAMVKLYNENEDFRKTVDTLWASVKNIFVSLVDIVNTVWTDTLQPVFSAFWELIKLVWDTFAEAVGAIVTTLAPFLLEIFNQIKFAIDALVVVVKIIAPTIGEATKGAIKFFTDLLNNIKTIFGGITKFISGVFTGDWKKAWEGVKDIFKGVFNALAGIAKAPLNIIIGFINGLLKGITNGINTVIRKINTLSWKVPSWVPVIGG